MGVSEVYLLPPVSSQFFGESLAVAGLLTEPRWLGQETGHSHPGLLRGYFVPLDWEALRASHLLARHLLASEVTDATR